MASLGYIISFVGGTVLWFWFAGVLIEWVGVFFGFLLSIMFSPGLVLFPLIYRFVEGSWPTTTYFMFFILSCTGFLISMASHILYDDLDDY